MEDIRYEYYHDRDRSLTVAEGHSTLCSPHFHRCFEILYVLEGSMLTTVEERQFVVNADEIVFVHNYYKHAFTPVPAYEKLFVVLPWDFSDDLTNLLSGSTLPCALTDRKFNAEVLRPIFVKLFNEREGMSTLVQKGYINVMLGNMLAHYPTVPIEKNNSIGLLVAVLNYIDLHYDKPLTLELLADKFGYNKYYFSRLFNRVVGESISNYVNVVRLRNFMHLLKEGENAPIAETAFACGFDSLTTFYRCFNKVYNTSPKAYLAGSAVKAQK